MKQKQQLVFLAQELAIQGIAVEAARKKLKDLVEAGVPYSAEEMLCGAENFRRQQERWDELEKQYLLLRKEIKA